MFACLPYDIIWRILSEFVQADGVRGLSTLEVAFCNHSLRPDILRYMTQVTGRSMHRLASEQLGGCLNWLALRRMPWMSELSVKPADLPGIMRHLVHPLEHVTKMSFSGKFPLSYKVMSSIAPFVACFPALEEMNCSERFSGANELTDHHLKGLVNMKCPLTALKIVRTLNVSAAMMSLVLSSVTGTLKDLTCDMLDDAALICLAHELKHLETLRFACDHIKSLSSVRKFCAGVSNSLKSVTVYLTTSPEPDDEDEDDEREGVLLDDALVETITSAAVNLKYISIGVWGEVDEPGVTANSLRYILANNTNVTTIALRGTAFFVQERHGNGNIDVNMQFGRNGDNEFVASFCSVDNLVVRDLSDQTMGFRCNRKTLRLIGNRWGRGIQSFECEFDDSVLDADFEYFLECSPNIKTLELISSASVGDNGLSMLPIFCSKVESLKISSFDKITDDGMLRLLKGYQCFNALKELSLSHCAQLGDDTLEHIAEIFPCLRALRLSSMGVSEELILELILEGKLRAQEIECDEAEWVEEQLVNADFDPIPNLWS